jgi:hypothetical protein
MAISGHRSLRMLEQYTHPTTARSWTRSPRILMGRIRAEPKISSQKKLVDGARLELATSALRTRRSPN